MHNVLPRMGLVLALSVFFLLTTGATLVGAPAHTQTLAAGPYIIDFNLYQDPPFADTPLMVTVVPHQSTLHLQGSVTAEPGLGTDATALHFPLTALDAGGGSLAGTIRMPVRGAWNIVIDLKGPQGSGSGQVAVIVAAPGAIPTWLGWLIGTSPLPLIAFWVWRQHHYKHALMGQTPEARPTA